MSLHFACVVVVGAGKMGGALVDGWLAGGMDPSAVRLIDPVFGSSDAGQAQSAWDAKGVRCFSNLDDLLATNVAGASNAPAVDLLMLAIKPQMMDTVLPILKSLDDPGLTVLSVAAGTTLDQLQSTFGRAVCVRTMPNTPAAVGKGITAAYGPQASAQQRAGILHLLQAVGQAVWVEEERLIDAVTAISGSGPAYVFHMVEALARAGVALGLNVETAMLLARQTIVGAGALLDASPQSAEQLRINVTSPGGTTAAGLEVLQASGRLDALMQDTAKAAYDRSIALSSSSAPTRP